MPMPPLALIRQMIESGSKELPALMQHIGDYALSKASLVPDFFKTGQTPARSAAEAQAKYGVQIGNRTPYDNSGALTYNIGHNQTDNYLSSDVIQKKLMNSPYVYQSKLANLVGDGHVAPDMVHNQVNTIMLPEGQNAGKKVYSAIHDNVIATPDHFTLPVGLTPNNQYRNGINTANSLLRHQTEDAGQRLMLDPSHQLNGLKTFQPDGSFGPGMTLEDYYHQPLNQKIGNLLTNNSLATEDVLNTSNLSQGDRDLMDHVMKNPQGGLQQFKDAAKTIQGSDIPSLGDSSLRWSSILDALSNGNEGAIDPALFKGLGFADGGVVHTPDGLY